MGKPKLFAVIGVSFRDGLTLYVKRSAKMQNYPNVWSLLSTQFLPDELPDVRDLAGVQRLMDRMSLDRLGGVPIETKEFLTSGESDANTMGLDVHLSLYRIEFSVEPVLNPEFYSAMKWMTAVDFERHSVNQQCGLCMRLWSDFAWLSGLTDRPFVPTTGIAADAR